MKSLMTRLATAAALCLAATSTLAADAPAGKAGVVPKLQEGIVPMLVAIGVFIVVLAIASKLVWPKILGGLRDRENKIREEIEAAEMARTQAKDALEQYQQSLAQARAEAQKMIETTKAQQATLAAELRAKADAELSAMRDRAMRDIEAAKRAAVSEIYNLGTTVAIDAASKILRRNVNSNDTQRLVEESLQQLQTSGKA
ncbi:MAG TPA: F0F1 ATP synthase subunit B [Phycisphaerales bacterium]|nr:F0F1 ATP synthase subunit B [Phycisphaerales bacterium]